MGRSFRWLLGSSWVSNIGDGIALAAGPLLVASLTDSAILVALAAMLQRLPWLVFGLWAGALADRLDRRLVVIVANTLRAAVVAALCVAITTDRLNVGVVLVTMALLGIAEVFADTTSETLLPMLVTKKDIGIGNARLQAGFLTANQLVGPALGAFLFATGTVWPFVTEVVCVLLAVLLVSRIGSQPYVGVGPDADRATHIRSDIAEGLRWILAHPPVRTLALVILVFNITWAAPWGIMVKYALDHLHMSEVEFGLLTTASAIGGLVAAAAYGRIERRFAPGTMMRVCLALEVTIHAALALTTARWVALMLMVVFGAYASVWHTVSSTVRQRAVPTRFQGRVASVYMVCVVGGLVVGQGIGGVLAEQWDLTTPFWFAFAGSGITLVLVWSQLAHIAHADSGEDAGATG